MNVTNTVPISVEQIADSSMIKVPAGTKYFKNYYDPYPKGETKDEFLARMEGEPHISRGTKRLMIRVSKMLTADLGEHDFFLDLQQAEVVKMPVITSPFRKALLLTSEWKIDKPIIVFRKDDRPGWPTSILSKQFGTGALTVVSKQYVHDTGEKVVDVDIGGERHFATLRDLYDNVTLTKAAPVKTKWVIRDKATGEYYVKYQYPKGTGPITANPFLKYHADPAKAKKFPAAHMIGTHLLIQSGYYDELPNDWDLPMWMVKPKEFDIPDTWEAVPLEEAGPGTPVDVITNFKRNWALRPLLVKFGSPVKALFKKLEKKPNYAGMVYFTAGEEQPGVPKPFTAEHQAAVDAAIKIVGKKMVKVGDDTGCAVAIETLADALAIRLAWQHPELTVAVLDTVKLEEVIQNAPTP